MKILLTGGGTAGHAFPVILVGQSLLRNRQGQILYLGSRQGIEKKLAGEYKIPYRAIFTGKRRNYFSLWNFLDLFKIFLGIIQSFFILIFYRPNVVFAKGGYVTVPALFWLRFFKIPLVIHESDAVIGRANRWVLNRAKIICLGFPVACYEEPLPISKARYTGIPVHPDFLTTSIQSGERLKILVTGGSQGASKINDLILEILPDLTRRYEIWHLSGERNFAKLSEFKNPYYHLSRFTLEMPRLMAGADLVISRAGAGTLAEISATGKAAILIPLPTAASGHQDANARVYAKRNAAIVVSEKNLTGSSLKSSIESLMSDENLRKSLGAHARELFCPKSTEEIIEAIFEAAGK